MNGYYIAAGAVAFIGIQHFAVRYYINKLNKLNTELQETANGLRMARRNLMLEMTKYKALISKTTPKTPTIPSIPSRLPPVTDEWLANLDAQIEREKQWQECKRRAYAMNHSLRRRGDNSFDFQEPREPKTPESQAPQESNPQSAAPNLRKDAK